MTNAELTYIGILVDRSGSMNNMREEMENAIKVFITDQAQQPGKARVTLAQFDTVYETVYEWTKAGDVPLYHLIPRGGTALNDGIGKLVTDSGERLAKMKESERPGKVIIVIVTDGYENSSREWTQQSVKKLIKQQTDTYSWEFVFLGANIDAVQVADGYGIMRGSALTFTNDSAPVAMAAMSSYVTNTRSGNVASFTDEDRLAAGPGISSSTLTSSGKSK